MPAERHPLELLDAVTSRHLKAGLHMPDQGTHNKMRVNYYPLDS